MITSQPLSMQQVEQLISSEVTTGLEYVYSSDEIAAQRDRNWEYYNGVMGDLSTQRGRSSVMDYTVRAYIDMLMPMLMRIFTAGRNIGEYVSPDENAIKLVKLMTRYVNDVVLRKDNRGELLLQNWAFDALVQKVGVLKGWWETKYDIRDETYTDLSDDDALMLYQTVIPQGGEIIEHTGEQVEVADQFGNVMLVTKHDVKVRHKVNTSCVKLECIPPEEFIISRDARTLEDAVMIAHRTGVFVGDLIEQGFDPALVEKLPTYSMPYPDSLQKYQWPQGGTLQTVGRDTGADKSLRKVTVIQGIFHCNLEGDGIRPWFFTAGGDANQIKLLEIEPYKHQVFFADFCPAPLPHTFFGNCPADTLAERQKVNTVLVRQMLDNLYLSNTPQREVVQDLIVKPDQLMNMSPGAPILVKAAGAIREIAVPFTAQHALTALEYFNNKAELESGVSKASAGLDPEALQNQSATSAAIAHSASLGKVEMIARNWAQGGMRKLFSGILNCLVEYQDYARDVQIDAKREKIDPRMWRPLKDIDVTINTGLGTGNRERDAMMLQGVIANQKEIMGTLGPNNPIVDIQKIVRAYQAQAEAVGIQNPEAFYGDPVNADGTPWQWQPTPPQPSPDTVLNAQTLERIEGQKTQAKMQTDIYKANVDAAKDAAARNYDYDRLNLEAVSKDSDAAFKVLDLELEAFKAETDRKKVNAS